MWMTSPRTRKVAGAGPPALFAQFQLLRDGQITIGVGSVQIIQQTTPLPNHHQQTATRAMVLVVLLQVLRERIDSLGQQSDLSIGGAGVLLVQTKGLHNLVLIN